MNRDRVLIVEDDEDIRSGTFIRLEAAGYDVIEACNGKQAVQKAESESPEIIVMDIRMPVMDGLTAMKHLSQREQTSRIPIIISSASLPERQLAIDAGAKCFLPKPHLGHTLLNAVSHVIHNHQI